MPGENAVILGTVVVYLLILLGIGEYARRRTKENREDYFLASRTFKTVALLFGLLATLLTAFAVLGAPGLAYKAGIGVYGYISGNTTLWIPVLIATVGYRIWVAGKAFGHVTPAQLINHRYETKHLGTFLMLLMTFWTIPYLLLGVMGGGITLESMTNGLISYPLGAAIVTIVVFIYITAGGMRGATWTNIVQGALFVFLLVALLGYMSLQWGGFVQATQATLAEAPHLATRAGVPPFQTPGWLSFALVTGMAMVMFPQMFLRFFTAFSPKAFKKTVVLFPIGLMLVYGSSTLFGFWGHGQIPGLTGAEVDQIFPLLVTEFLPLPLVGLGMIVILSAIMSSLDAQALTLSTMFSEDLVRASKRELSERKEVLITRGIIFLVLVVVYLISLLRIDTIFDIGAFAFEGYALLFYPFVIGLYWKRATPKALWAGWSIGFIILWLFKLGVFPSAWTFGFMKFIPALAVQIIVVHGVSMVTEAPSGDRVSSYFDAFEGVW